MSSSLETENQKYRLVLSDSQFEIRFYPPATFAKIYSQGTDKGSTMSFVMPEKYQESDLPKPNDSGVHIVKSSPQYVAAISFGGYADDEKIK